MARTWSVDDGLPQGTVYDLTQTGDGYVWIATLEGFVRFDGTEFVVYDRASVPAVRNNMVVALLAAHDGSLYAGTNGGGLIQVTGRQTRTFGLSDGLPNLTVSALHQSSDRTLWIGTQAGLARRQNDGRISIVAAAHTLPDPLVTSLTEDWSGRLWIGTRKGLATLKDGKLTRHDDDGFPTDHIVSLTTSRDGSVWISTNGGGLVRHRADHFRVYSAADGLPSKSIGAVYEDRHGVIWVGTLDHGVGRFRDDRFDFGTDIAGIGKKAVSSFLEDQEGNLWIGSAHGLTRIAEGLVRSFTTAQGLRGEKVRAVHAGPSGDIWIGTAGGLQTLNGKSLSKGAGLTSNSILSVSSSRDGAMWVGTWDAGLQRVANGKTTVFDTSNGLRSNVILSMWEDRNSAMWVGTAAGLQRIVDGKVMPDVYKLSGHVVGVVYEDRAGAIWAGTQDGGLNRLLGGKVTSFTSTRGLSSDFILSIHQDRIGTLWVGTAGGGLNRLKDGRWTAITSREGLFDDNVFAILEDDDGYFWMSSNKGIFRVQRQQLDEVASGLLARVNSVAYGTADGMAARECNGGTQPVAARGPDGTLWFATTNGVASIDPKRARNATAPPVFIQGMYVDGKRIEQPNPEPLAAGTKRVEFHYAGLHFSAPGKVRYQYKLEGFDADWVDAGNRRRAYYTNLPAGSYLFRVRAAIDDGPWNMATAALSQRAFFYQSRWFLGLCAALLLAAVGFAHRARVKIIRASAERFKLLFDRNPAGSYRATAAGGLLDCNDACAKLFGFVSRAELMTHGLAGLDWIEIDWDTLVSRLREERSVANLEVSLSRADQSQIWLLMNANLVADALGNPVIEATVIDISERKREEEAVRFKAHHDVLTGLPNRALFKDRLTVALNYAHRQGNQLAVLSLDLDGFKLVNDALGREGGDHILQAVAERLRDSSRQEDSLARVGDDEFSLLIMRPANLGDVTSVARKVLQEVAIPIKIDGHDFNITSSIGIAFYPQDGGDAEALLKNADSALHRAKESGRNSYHLCSPFLARKAAERLALETALYQAIDQNEFVLHYQPQLDLETQTVTGMEALIRWDRPGKSMLLPADFIGVAEDTNLILPIGEWAIETACRQGQQWHEQGNLVRMAVNVSPRQFQQPNIVSIIRDALDQSGFDPSYLEIEITESTAMLNPDLTAEILLDLKNLGMSVAIDDFGVGYSSLNYLKRFPIDVLKIDQSFVQDISRGGSDGAIISAVIALSKALNIRVIAEGVETEEQLQFLRDHGCHEAQGYLFCRPMPAEALTRMIESETPGAYTRKYARKVQAHTTPERAEC